MTYLCTVDEQLEIRGERFIFHFSGALYWEKEGILLISDVHLGKVSHFRKHGAAVPNEAIYQNFRLLDTAIEHFRPKHIYFLGDLFHSHLNGEWDLFESWVHSCGPEITLVAGNHDVISPLKYEALGIRVVQELVEPPFFFTHHPQTREELYNFSGHIHPAVRLKGLARQTVRVPCFFCGEEQMILPAFGAFTGSHTLKPGKKDQVFAIAGEEVIKIG